MKYKVSYSKGALKQLRKLDKQAARMIVHYMRDIENLDNPKERGKELTGNLSGIWRYRIDDYRVLCRFEDDVLIIFVIEVGHRKNVYG